MTNQLFYIGLNSVSNKNQKSNTEPKIFKIEKNSEILKIEGEEMEGPFISIANLKKESKIYSEIINSKTKQSILNPANIVEIKKITLIPFEHSYEPSFIKLFLHAWIGKIHKNDILGVHFYNTENVKILQILNIDKNTGVYSAMISYFDKKKEIWIEKSKPTNLFPDNWTIQKLFKELDCAYLNRTHEQGSVYYGNTSENIKVKIIIKDNNALTMYPVV